MTSPTAHFEIHVTNVQRATEFYADLFGWGFEEVSDPDYHLVVADGIGPNQPVAGALMARNGPTPDAGTSPRGALMTFPVSDVDGAYAKALATGGAEALPPTDFPHAGRVAFCEDGEGNIVGMVQAAGGA